MWKASYTEICIYPYNYWSSPKKFPICKFLETVIFLHKQNIYLWNIARYIFHLRVMFVFGARSKVRIPIFRYLSRHNAECKQNRLYLLAISYFVMFISAIMRWKFYSAIPEIGGWSWHRGWTWIWTFLAPILSIQQYTLMMFVVPNIVYLVYYYMNFYIMKSDFIHYN